MTECQNGVSFGGLVDADARRCHVPVSHGDPKDARQHPIRPLLVLHAGKRRRTEEPRGHGADDARTRPRYRPGADRASRRILSPARRRRPHHHRGDLGQRGRHRLHQRAGYLQPVPGRGHAEASRIYLQVAHSGAVSHPDFFAGLPPLAPSAVNPGLRAFTNEGFKETVVPREMTLDQIKSTIGDYAAAEDAKAPAGHVGRMGALPRRRQDLPDDGDGRLQSDRSNGCDLQPPRDAPQRLPLSHVQLVKAPNDLKGTPIQVLQETVTYFRPRIKGTLIANFGYDKTSANAVLAAKQADLVSFGNAFIGNPDLVRRMRKDIALSPSNRDLYYQGGAEGYTDYPPAA